MLAPISVTAFLPRWADVQPAPQQPTGPMPEPPPEIKNRPQPPPPGPPPPLPDGAQPAQPPAPAPAPPTTPANPGKGPFQKPTTVSITRDFDRPVLDNTRLGSIPQDYYQWTWGWGWPYGSSNHVPAGGSNNDFGPVGVYRDVPEQNADGSPRMRHVTETVTDSTYSEEKRTIGCGVAGLAAGVGGAALTGSLMGSHAGPLGMVVGGVLGAVAGAAIGLKTAQGDTLKEVWVTDAIEKPTFTGYTEYLQPQYHYEQECHTVSDGNGGTRQECYSRQVLDGFWHQFSPDIQWTPIGSFKRPTLQHTAPIGSVGGGALAVGAGLAVGAAVAAIATAVL